MVQPLKPSHYVTQKVLCPSSECSVLLLSWKPIPRKVVRSRMETFLNASIQLWVWVVETRVSKRMKMITNRVQTTRKHARCRCWSSSPPDSVPTQCRITTTTAHAFRPDVAEPAETCAVAVCRWTPLPVPEQWRADLETVLTLFPPIYRQ